MVIAPEKHALYFLFPVKPHAKYRHLIFHPVGGVEFSLPVLQVETEFPASQETLTARAEDSLSRRRKSTASPDC